MIITYNPLQYNVRIKREPETAAEMFVLRERVFEIILGPTMPLQVNFIVGVN